MLLSSQGPHTALRKTDWTRFPFTVFCILLRGPKNNLGEKQIWASFTFCQYGDEEGKVQLKKIELVNHNYVEIYHLLND